MLVKGQQRIELPRAVPRGWLSLHAGGAIRRNSCKEPRRLEHPVELRTRPNGGREVRSHGGSASFPARVPRRIQQSHDATAGRPPGTWNWKSPIYHEVSRTRKTRSADRQVRASPGPAGRRAASQRREGRAVFAGRLLRSRRDPARPDRVLLARASGGSIRYELEGVFPGSNLVSPTILRRIGRDAPLAVAKPKSLVVLPQGARAPIPIASRPTSC